VIGGATEVEATVVVGSGDSRSIGDSGEVGCRSASITTTKQNK